jgi:hypothetical protein
MPDVAKLTIGAVLVVLGLYGGYLIQDTLREPDQNSNIVLRRVGYFWIDTGGEAYQIGAILKLYNLGSRATLLKGVVLETAMPQITGRGQAHLRTLAAFEPRAEVYGDNFVKAGSDASYKVLLPMRMEATIDHPPPPAVAYVGTWQLQLRNATRAVQPELSGTFDRVITTADWQELLSPGSSVSPDVIHYEPAPSLVR